MSLAKKIEKLLNKKDDTLVRRYASKEEKKLLDRSLKIDKIDRILGPIESLMQVYGDPTTQVMGTIISAGELIFLKIPFIYNYLKTTKDYEALNNWAPREIIAATLAFGDLVDITHAYHRRTIEHLEKKVIKENNY